MDWPFDHYNVSLESPALYCLLFTSLPIVLHLAYCVIESELHLDFSSILLIFAFKK